ncbi:MAG: hypothetical protein AAFY28_17145 [Actinomycetota bacterium]
MVSLIVGEHASQLRRNLGAASWVALEELTVRPSTDDGSARVVAASVRNIADSLGISKNAAHRAHRRLIAADLISPVQRRDDGGRFLAGTYRLTVDPDLLRSTHDPAPARPATNRTPRPRDAERRQHGDDSQQLTLLST